MNRNTTIGIVVILGALAGIIFLTTKQDGQKVPDTSTNNTATSSDVTISSNEATSSTTFTLSDVAKHKDASSCYTAINGSVYDLTVWVNQHPGGPENILMLCGKDGSEAFNAQHGGQGAPAAALVNFKIGALAQ